MVWELRIPKDDLSDLFSLKLSPITLKLYLALNLFKAKDDNTCFPSMTTLAEIVGKPKRTIQASMRDLEAIGLVDTTRQCGKGNTNIYKVYPPRLVNQGFKKQSPKGSDFNTFSKLTKDEEFDTEKMRKSISKGENLKPKGSDFNTQTYVKNITNNISKNNAHSDKYYFTNEKVNFDLMLDELKTANGDKKKIAILLKHQGSSLAGKLFRDSQPEEWKRYCQTLKHLDETIGINCVHGRFWNNH